MSKGTTILKWIFVPLLVIVILLLAGALSLQNPTVQTKLARYFTTQLSKQLDTKVTIGRVDVDFFTQLTVTDFYVEDKSGDTLFYAGKIHSKAITFAPFKNTFLLNDSRLENVNINITRSPTDSLSNLDKLFVDRSPTGDTVRNKRSLNLSLKDATIVNFDFNLHDSLTNKFTDVALPTLAVDFDRFSIGKKKIVVRELFLYQPDISLISVNKVKQQTVDTTKFATPVDWLFSVDELEIVEGRFVNRSVEKREHLQNSFSPSNFEATRLNLQANQVQAENNRLDFAIDHLSFHDETGFTINHLATNAWLSDEELSLQELNLETPYSTIDGNVLFKLKYLSDFSDFENKIRLKANLKSVELAPEDMAYLFGNSPTKEKIYVSGIANGKLSNLSTQNFELRFENGTMLKGDIDALGLPDLQNTFFDAKIDRLYTNTNGIQRLTGNYNLSDKITKLGEISFSGEFLGYLSELVTYGTIQTELGNLEADVKFSNPNKTPIYSGFIASDEFDLGYWLGNDQLGILDFSATVDGRNFNLSEMNTSVDATVNRIDFNNHVYNNISFDGDINNQLLAGNFLMNDIDLNGHLTGRLDFSQPKADIEFDSEFERVDLYQLGLIADPLTVSGQFSGLITGNNLDEFRGVINAKNATVITANKTVGLDQVDIQLKETENKRQLFNINTGTIQAEILGKYKFSELFPTFLQTVNTYYDFERGWEDATNTIESNQKIGFEIDVKKEDELLNLFLPNLVINADIEADGYINPLTKEVSIVASSENIGYSNFLIKNWELDAIGDGEVLIANSFQDELYNNGKEWLVNSEVNVELSGNEILSDIRTYNDEFLSAKLTSNLTKRNDGSYLLKILSSDLIINEQVWNINENNSIVFGNGDWDAENFILSNGEQKIEIYDPEGDLNTKLIADIQNFDMQDFNHLIGFTNKPFEGDLSGKLRLIELANGLNIDVDLSVSEFMYNYDVVDVVALDGQFNLDNQVGSFEGILNDADFQVGLTVDLDLKREQDILDLNLELYRASLSPFGNLWADSIEDLEGYSTGFMHIVGGPKVFNLDGDIELVSDLALTLKFTQARYTIPEGETIKIERNRFRIDDLTLIDPYNNEAKLRGAINHNDLSEFNVNVFGEFDNFLFLNTTEQDNEIFYGTAFAKGDINITGPVSDVFMDINATTMPNTEIHIENSSSSETGQYKFIRFRKPKVDSVEVEDEMVNESLLTMRFNLDIRPTANVYMHLDSDDYNTLFGNGTGNLEVNFNTADLFEIFGIYEINTGSYIVNFEELLAKRFDIQQGGTIRMAGDPLKARLDVNAKLNIPNADAGALVATQQLGSSNRRSTNVNTDIIVNFSETLADPRIDYELEVGNATSGSLLDEQIRVINSNETLLEKQIFSLLFLEQFTGNNSSPFATEQNFGNVAFNSITSIVSRQVTNFLNQVDGLENTDIGIIYENYRDNLGTDLESGLDQQLQLQLSQVIADKVKLSVGSDFNFGENLDRSANNMFMVGDIVAEIDIDDDGKYEVKLFSVLDYNLLARENDRRNGVGFIIEKQFDHFKDLFKSPKTIQEEAEEKSNTNEDKLDEDSPIFREETAPTIEPEKPSQENEKTNVEQIDEDSPYNNN